MDDNQDAAKRNLEHVYLLCWLHRVFPVDSFNVLLPKTPADQVSLALHEQAHAHIAMHAARLHSVK